jgi:hypothetical protein
MLLILVLLAGHAPKIYSLAEMLLILVLLAGHASKILVCMQFWLHLVIGGESAEEEGKKEGRKREEGKKGKRKGRILISGFNPKNKRTTFRYDRSSDNLFRKCQLLNRGMTRHIHNSFEGGNKRHGNG